LKRITSKHQSLKAKIPAKFSKKVSVKKIEMLI